MRFFKLTTMLVIQLLWLLAWPAPFRIQTPANVRDSSDIAVIVNASNPTDGLSMTDLREILLGERKFWKNKTPITIVLTPPGSRERDIVIRAVLHMDEAAFRQHWKDKLFRGEALAQPLTVPSSVAAGEYVSSNPGSLAFVPGKMAPSDLKVLPINSRLPGAGAYPFKNESLR